VTTAEEWQEKAVRLLSDMVSIPSVNPGEGTPGAIHLEQRMAEYIRDYFERKSFPYHIAMEDVLPGRPNIVVRTGDDPGKRTILLETHTDTVGIENMTVEPFTPAFSDGKLYGRGSMDAKGQLVAMIMALEMAVEESGQQLPVNVILAATSDEEHLHRGVDRLIETPLKVDGAIVGEASELRVIIATKGSIRFQIRASGIPAHSSSPREGKNAIYLMSKVIHIIANDIAPMLEKRTHPLCGYSTVSVTLIRGGQQVNIIPEDCVIDVDRRLLPGECWEDAYNEIKEMINGNLDSEGQSRISFEYPYLIDPSLESDTNSTIIRTFSGELKKCGLDGVPIGAPFGTDASKIALIDIPVVVFGPGSIRQAHTKDEYIVIEELMRAAEIMKKVILTFDQYAAETDKSR
jgi:acetylornithine deacetylase/succinyl-diaminopimelate desuccinylase family protein